VSFDKTIPPGGKGAIRIYIDTSGYEGEINKSVLVETDDPDNSEFTLDITANILAPIEISPKRVYLIGRRSSVVKAEVKIKTNLNRPLKITPIAFDLEGKVKYEIKEIKKDKIYKIVFIKLPSNDQMINGTLSLKTNYSKMPYIKISVRGYFHGR